MDLGPIGPFPVKLPASARKAIKGVRDRGRSAKGHEPPQDAIRRAGALDQGPIGGPYDVD